jgi:hypothetical protein
MASRTRPSNGWSAADLDFQDSGSTERGRSMMHKSDMRDGARVECELQATIEPDAGPTLCAVVRNISTRGARLEGADVSAAPERFDLLISRGARATERRRARRVWGIDDAVGILFLDRADACAARVGLRTGPGGAIGDA